MAAVTKAVVASWVVLVPSVAVGAVITPEIEPVVSEVAPVTPKVPPTLILPVSVKPVAVKVPFTLKLPADPVWAE
jgi:hypothetical protein